ncbi:MAG: hypothetical protein WCS77_07120 [Elusimicrobiaceae bacterium]
MDCGGKKSECGKHGFAALTRRLALSKGGQLAIPAVFIIPTLFIFVFLLFETAKLSREKIKRQFAVDSATFIELQNYSDNFNRFAYVNGAFPHRIFREAYPCKDKIYHTKDNSSWVCTEELMLANGDYPVWAGMNEDGQRSQTETGEIRGGKNLILADSGIMPNCQDANQCNVWPIRYQGCGVEKTKMNKEIWTNGEIGDFYLLRKDKDSFDCPGVNGQEYSVANLHLSQKRVKEDLFPFWHKVYALLGKVDEAQFSVMKSLVENHVFFRKSYYLNAGDCTEQAGTSSSDMSSCGETGLGRDLSKSGGGNTIYDAGKIDTLRVSVDKVLFWGRGKSSGGLNFDVEPTIPNEAEVKKLFQLRVLSGSGTDFTNVDKMGKGLHVYQGWVAEDNYFKINVNKLASCDKTNSLCVHVTGAVR